MITVHQTGQSEPQKQSVLGFSRHGLCRAAIDNVRGEEIDKCRVRPCDLLVMLLFGRVVVAPPA